MFDLDPEAREHVRAQHWLPGTDQHYLIGNVLDEGVWKQVKSRRTFLLAEDERGIKYERERGLTAKYDKLENDHAAGVSEFITNKDHPERKRLLKMIDEAGIKLCKPSDKLKAEGGLDGGIENDVFTRVAPEVARVDEHYTDLIARYRIVLSEVNT